MDSNKRIARLAGLFYLINIVLSVFYMEYVPAQLAVWDDPEATLMNLVNNEMLFRYGIFAGVIVHISFILLPLTLYRLLHHVNKNIASLMVVFALVSVPVSYSFMLEQLTFLDLLKDYPLMNEIQIQEMGIQALSMYESLMNGFFLDQTYWGLWLFPFGYLTFKSGFLPKVLGVSLMLGCITYLIDVTGGILFKNYYDYVDTSILIIPAAVGEIGSCLWLLIVGVKPNIKF